MEIIAIIDDSWCLTQSDFKWVFIVEISEQLKYVFLTTLTKFVYRFLWSVNHFVRNVEIKNTENWQ